MRMGNNLNERIRLSGMSKKQVAALNGVTPETISRQIHSRVQMTVPDAERYAAILNCTVQEILFQTDPIHIIAKVNVSSNNKINRTLCGSKPYGYVYSHAYYDNDNAAIYWNVDKNCTGIIKEFDKSIMYVLKSPIVDKYVHEACTQNWTLCRVRGSDDLLAGDLYPEPKGLYTLDQPFENNILRRLDLEWATPKLAIQFRPEIRGIQVCWE